MARKISKNDVRSALIDYIHRNDDGVRLPPLRTMSRELGVSIYLIRKNLDALQREGVLKGRNRIGMFLTPEQVHRTTVGIIINPATPFPYIDDPQLYAGLLNALAKRFFLIRAVSFRKISDLPKVARSFGLAGVIWVIPDPDEIRAPMSRLRGKLPVPLVFCGENIFNEVRFSSLSNTVSLDCDEFARQRARHFAAHSARNIVYFSSGTAALIPFRNELAKFGIRLPDECVIDRADQLDVRLTELMRSRGVDGILVDGSDGFYEQLFAFLHRNPKFRPLLSIEDHPRVRIQMHRYPDVHVDFPFESWHDFHARLGEQAADMLQRAMDGDLIQPPEKYSFRIADPVFARWEKNRFKPSHKQTIKGERKA